MQRLLQRGASRLPKSTTPLDYRLSPVNNSRCCLVQGSSAENLSPAKNSDPSSAQPMTASKPLAPPGLSRTFYKRELPSPPAIAFSSEQGQQIFTSALVAGTMQGFFRLIEQFRTQDEPAYCGLASVSMVLNALAIDPRRTWKGPWRYFHEQMLDCCHPLEKVREEGITLEQAACLARCNGAAVEVYPFGSISLEEFREMVRLATTTAENHLVVSYSRRAFLQTGDGHFSPIGGYSPHHDMVLILDTARFKYPPHWVRLEELYEAMKYEDSVTKQPRGFMRLGLLPLQDSVLFTLDVRSESWVEAFNYATTCLSLTINNNSTEQQQKQAVSVESVIANIVNAAPVEAVKKFIAVRMAGNSCNGGVCTQVEAIDTFLHELRSLPLYHAIYNAVPLEEKTTPPEEEKNQDKQEKSECGGGCLNSNDENAKVIGKEVVEDAFSKNAAALSSAKPAVPGPLLPERLTMLLLLGTDGGQQQNNTFNSFQGVNEDVKRELESLFNIKAHKLVKDELDYLREQFNELPMIEQALEAAAVSGALPCSEEVILSVKASSG